MQADQVLHQSSQLTSLLWPRTLPIAQLHGRTHNIHNCKAVPRDRHSDRCSMSRHACWCKVSVRLVISTPGSQIGLAPFSTSLDASLYAYCRGEVNMIRCPCNGEAPAHQNIEFRPGTLITQHPTPLKRDSHPERPMARAVLCLQRSAAETSRQGL